MANIPVRDYCREIENMIDKGHTDQAIAHARHILKHFPKHIEAYRLLGKALLESRQLGDAADVFQRVLSSLPADFVSHIGMSIIREDEGNLDAAIWHMERAFENQSSNLAIQDELRRLYGNRDQVEPPKIRLTRGALARMYGQGHLYSQAIAEIRAALSTDPKRMDLQVLLAQMYHQDNQQTNAAKIASQLINKLPYCLVANQILFDILSDSQRENEAKIHRERLEELDPYYKHISAQNPTPDSVPSGVILVEMLDWEASKSGLTSQPAWATSLGVDISNASASEDLPDWLSPTAETAPTNLGLSFGKSDFEQGDYSDNSLSDNLFNNSFDHHSFEDNSFEDSFSPFSDSGLSNFLEPEAPAAQENTFEEKIQSEATTMQDDDNIPDWMKEAGWAPRDPNAPEEPTSLFNDEEEEPAAPQTNEEGDIAMANIPDWLKAMAPKDTDDQDPFASSDSGTDLPDWLQEGSTADTAPVKTSSQTSSMPEWLQSQDNDEIEAVPTAASDMPDWLQEMSSPSPSPSLASEEDLDVPEWLKEVGGTDTAPAASLFDTEEEGVSGLNTPDWLHQADETEIEPAPPIANVEADFPEWLSNIEEKAPIAAGDAPAMSWLDSEETEEDDTSLHSGVTDWLSSMDQTEMNSTEEALPSEDIPDWLQDFGQDVPGTGELFQLDEEPIAKVPETTFAVEDLAADATLSATDMDIDDDAMAWLESLAAKQGAKEEEFLISPAERQETAAPSWLNEITDASFDQAEAMTDEAEEAGVPEWLREMSTEEKEPALFSDEQEMDFPEPSTFAENLLLSMEAEEITFVQPEPEPAQEAGMPEFGEDDDAAMAWLESLAAKHGAKEEELLMAPDERTEEIPSWLHGVLDEEPKEGLETISKPMDETDLAGLFEDEEDEGLFDLEPEMEFDLDLETEPETPSVEEPEELSISAFESDADLEGEAALAWLESLAAKHGVNEDELLTAAENRPEDTPNWVQDVAAKGELDEAAWLEGPGEPAGDLGEEFFAEELEAELEPEMVEETPEPVALAGDVTPDWLSSLVEEEEEPLPEVEGEDVPDWLRETETSQEEFIFEEEPAFETVEETGEEPVQFAEEAEIPAWLLGEEEPAAPTIETPGEEMPSWILEEPEPQEEIKISIFVDEESLKGDVIEEPEPEPELEDITLSEEPVAAEVPEPVMAVPLEGALGEAQTAIQTGDLDTAITHYEHLIKQRQNLDEVIAQVQDALNTRYPVDVGLWQTLGDAHFKNDALQEALDAYTKAEELLR